MPLSIVELLGDGSSDVFTFQFDLGFLSRSDVTVEVDGEVDGLGNPAQREIVWISDGVIQILGDIVPNGTTIFVKRTVEKAELTNTYADGASLTQRNLDRSFKQTLMAVHEILDGRIDGFAPGVVDEIFADATEQVALAAAEADRAFSEADRARGEADRATAYGDLLVGVQNVTDYPSRTAAALLSIDPGVNHLKTNGYTTEGDGGGGHYKRVGSQPQGHPGWFQSADGAYWELNEFLTVTEKQMGGIGDGVADDTVACQGAIDYGLYRDGNTFSAMAIEVVLIGPKLLTSDTLHMGYDNFNRCRVRGQDSKHRNENGMMGTAIVASFTDRPIINMQGGRGSSLRDIWIEGALDMSAVQAVNDTHDITLEATWDAAGGNNRYTPYCGVSFGAYDGNQSERYPTVTYPAWTGIATQYDKVLGSNPEIHNVGVRYVNTAFVGKPGNDFTNEDFITIRDCTVEWCMYAVSIAHHQSRNVEIRNMIGANIWTVFTTEAHGIQTGRFGGVVDNCSFGGFIGRLFEFGATSILAPTTFTNLYVEGLYRIGDFVENTAAEASIMFTSCTFSFTQTDEIGVPATVLGSTGNSADITFQQCLFSGYRSVLSFIPTNVRSIRSRLTPQDRNATDDILVAEIARAFFQNGTCGGWVIDQQPRVPQSIRYNPVDLGTGVFDSDILCEDGMMWEGGRTFTLPMYASKFQLTTERHGHFETFAPRGFYSRNLVSHFSSRSLVDRTLTMTMDTVDLDGDEHYLVAQGLAPGDGIRCRTTGTVFMITNRAGNVITAELQNNFRDDGAGGYTTVTDWDVDTNYALEFLCCHNFLPTYSTYGDFTNASPVMTNVGRHDGFSTYISTDLLPGDTFGIRTDKDRAIINNDREILSVDDVAKTVTFTGNARATVENKDVTHWIMREGVGFIP